MSKETNSYRPTSFSMKSITTAPMATRGVSSTNVSDDPNSQNDDSRSSEFALYVSKLPDDVLGIICRLPIEEDSLTSTQTLDLLTINELLILTKAFDINVDPPLQLVKTKRSRDRTLQQKEKLMTLVVSKFSGQWSSFYKEVKKLRNYKRNMKRRRIIKQPSYFDDINQTIPSPFPSTSTSTSTSNAALSMVINFDENASPYSNGPPLISQYDTSDFHVNFKGNKSEINTGISLVQTAKKLPTRDELIFLTDSEYESAIQFYKATHPEFIDINQLKNNEFCSKNDIPAFQMIIGTLKETTNSLRNFHRYANSIRLFLNRVEDYQKAKEISISSTPNPTQPQSQPTGEASSQPEPPKEEE